MEDDSHSSMQMANQEEVNEKVRNLRNLRKVKQERIAEKRIVVVN